MVDYTVPTAAGSIAKSFGGLMTGLQDVAVRQSEEQKRLDVEQDIQRRLMEGAQLLETRDPVALSKFALQNPDVAKQFIEAANFQDALTEKSRLQMTKDVLSGRIGAREALQTRINEIESQGGDASADREDLETMSNDELRRELEIGLSIEDPRAYQAYLKATGFIDPARKMTASLVEFDRYQELKKKGKDKEAETLGKKIGIIPKDRTLSAIAEKELINSQKDYYKASSDAREYNLFLKDLDRFEGTLPSGVPATISSFIANIAGTQAEQEDLRRRFNKIRLAKALEYIPPGPATDRDVEEAFKGVPKENASPKQIRMFLNGAIKMANIQAEYEAFRSGYISRKNSTEGLIEEWEKKIADGEVESINALTPANEEQPVEEQATTILEEETARGGKVMIDAQGNRAVVFPDGTFREL